MFQIKRLDDYTLEMNNESDGEIKKLRNGHASKKIDWNNEKSYVDV